MSPELVKAIARARLLRQQRSDVHPTRLAQWAADMSCAQWLAVGLFVKEYLGGE